jgi:2-keto-4-pentenoate hydratase/2-oxohepta-3-ene-1,7-dioic acid hydratase in catechol pathway
MKLLRVGNFNQEKPAVLDNSGIIRDISSIIKDFDQESINEDLLKNLKKINLEKLPEISNKTRIGACISKPQKFIGIGLNYIDHAEEQNLSPPKEPIVFFKSPSCITGPNDEIAIPKKSNKTDWEVELGFAILKKAKNISEDNALEYILGFFIVNDVSEREWQKEKCGQWVKGKSADTFGPIGPYILTTDELSNYQNLDMKLDVNKERMQTGNTSKMIFNVKYLVSYLSQFMTLVPGDIITTGTPPGVGENKKPPIFLKGGEIVNLSIENLGEQTHNVINSN